MKVGVFDSGIGGLSVLHCAQKMLPHMHFVYYADEKHVPYGEKTPEEIRRFLVDIFAFLIDKKVDAIVIACNTATSAITAEYRSQLPVPIIGMEPAVKRAVDLYGDEGKRILVAATPVTIRGEKLRDLIVRVDQHKNVDLVGLPNLVRFAEKSVFSSCEIEAYLANCFEPLDLQAYGTVVLGCTHFNYFKRSIRRFFPDGIHFVDGNDGTVRQLMRVLSLPKDFGETGTCEFYFSGETVAGKELERIRNCMKQLDDVFDIK